jgi:hypothetical protein
VRTPRSLFPLLVWLVGLLLVCTLAACAAGSQGSLPTKPLPGSTDSPTPAAVLTGHIPPAAPSVFLPIPLATVEVLQTMNAVAPTYIAIAQATASAESATASVERATSLAEASITTLAAQATKTAFAVPPRPGSIVVPPGLWGGNGIAVRVLTNTVQVNRSCDGGNSSVPLTVDASGAFDIPGVYQSYGPVVTPYMPVRFQGHVIGSRLTLNIVSIGEDGRIYAGDPLTATLTLGQLPDLPECGLRCLAGNTLIDTPNGPVPVKELRKGIPVWTADASGKRQRATVLNTAQTKVPPGHQMVHLVLADGRQLLASPGHPMVDGRPIGTLTAGDLMNGMEVVSAERVPYNEDYTYDILPSGGTGTYWADGILIGSTLAGGAEALPCPSS